MVINLTSVPICKNHHIDAAIAGNLRVIIIIIIYINNLITINKHYNSRTTQAIHGPVMPEYFVLQTHSNTQYISAMTI